MSELAEIIQQNTDLFYYEKEQKIKEQEAFYQELFVKSLNGIQQNKQMFDDLKIGYTLTNQKGKAVLSTEVLIFKEDKEKLVLTLVGDYKQENGDKYYSYYTIDAGVDSSSIRTVYDDETALSKDYSNLILEILEKRPLGEFLNNFGVLYSQEKTRK